jgi:hypothetical protein
MASYKSRPILISLIAILEFLGGILMLLAGIVVVGGLVPMADLPPEFVSLGSAGGVALIIVGIIFLVIAGGFWNGWKIMWYLGMVFNGLALIVLIASIFTGGSIVNNLMANIIPIVIEILILFYLTRTGVRQFFEVA